MKKQRRQKRDKLSQPFSATFILVAVCLVLLLSVQMVSAVWWNPFTWFDNDNILEKNDRWVEVYSDNNDFEIIIPENAKHDADIYLCSKTATKKNDLLDLDFATSDKKNGKKLKSKEKLKPIKYEDKICYYYKPSNDEKFLKFDKHSTHMVYTNESIDATDDDGNIIGSLSLVTDDYDYKNGKPNVNIGFGEDQLTHTFIIENYTKDAISNLTAIDMNTQTVVNRNIKLKYLKYIPQNMSTYNDEYVVNGTKTIYLENWIEIDNDTVDGEDYLIGVFADVENGDYIDIDFNYYDISVKENPIDWSTWTSGLNTDLISYFKLNETTGTVAVDSLNLHNGTASNSRIFTASTPGIINNSADLTQGIDSISFGTSSDYSPAEISINMWVNLSSSGTQVIASKWTDSGNQRSWVITTSDACGNLNFHLSSDGGWGGCGVNAGYVLPLNKWAMVTTVYNGSYSSIYVNGTLEGVASFSGDLHDSTQTMALGVDGQGRYLDGLVDEFSVWNRSLSQAEITQLYNSHSAITYEESSGGSVPVVTLNTPIDTQNFTNPVIEFNCTASDGINLDNVTLYIDGVANETNTTGYNATDYIFTKTLETGSYNWSCAGVNNASVSTTPTALDFNVNTSQELSVTLNSPVDEFNSSSSNVYFNCSGVDSNGIDHVNLTINGTVYETLYGSSNETLTSTETLSDGYWGWGCTAENIYGDTINSETRYLTLDTSPPVVTISYPTATTYTSNVSVLNYTLVEDNENKCWYSTDGGVTNSTSASPANFTGVISTEGSNNWTVYCNDTSGLEGSDYVSFTRNTFTVVLNSPADTSISPLVSPIFNATANSSIGDILINMSLWTNETGSWAVRDTTTLNTTESNATNYSVSSLTPVLIKTLNIEGYITNASNILCTSDQGHNATVRYDINYQNGTTASITNTTALGTLADTCIFTLYEGIDSTKEVNSVEIYLWSYSYNVDHPGIEGSDLIFVSKTSSTEIFSRTVDGTILWNVQSCTSASCIFAPSNYTLSSDAGAPIITIENPTGALGTASVGDTVTLNITATDSSLDSCWYNYNGTNVTIPGCQSGIKNSTTFILEENNLNLTVYSNDTSGNTNSSFTSWTYKIVNNSNTYNATVFETSGQTFTSQVTANASLTAVNLEYDGTNYTMTDSGSGTWTTTIQIPTTSVGVVSAYYHYTYGSETISSTAFNQTVNDLVWEQCNATYSDVFSNFTFQNENNESALNGSIPLANFTYYLGDGTVTETTLFSNTTEALNYTFCSNAGSATLNMHHRIQYASTGYPQRVFEPATHTATNTTLTNETLYLLSAADGIYVTFQVINVADQTISNVKFNATRLVGTEQKAVGDGYTDAAGAVTLWLNPDFVHTFILEKENIDTVTTSFAPTQSSYTITMGATSQYTGTDYTKGITFTISPAISLKSLYNDTEYFFNYTLSSSIFTITEFGFNLTNEDGDLLGTTQLYNNGGTVAILLNVGKNSSIVMNRWYVTNETYHSATQYWKVINSEGSEYSIKVFFEDLGTYMDSGIFGLTSFGFKLIIFLLIFISIGIMSYMYGVTNEGILSVFVFAVVFFVDYGLDLIPRVAGMPYLPTFVIALITLGVLTRGWRT